MIRNLLYGSKPCIVHAPGKLEFLPTWDAIKNISLQFPIKSRLPRGLSIVTFNNDRGKNDKTPGLFELSCQLSGLHCDVLGRGVSDWKNSIRIKLLLDYIVNIDGDYILVADSADVLIVRNIIGIIDEFNKYECQALFNAEKCSWPLDLPAEIVNYEYNKHNGCFLNAGLWLANIPFTIEMLKFLNKFSLQHPSDQYYYKFAYVNFNQEIKLDLNCRIFQGLNRVFYNEVKVCKMY